MVVRGHGTRQAAPVTITLIAIAGLQLIVVAAGGGNISRSSSITTAAASSSSSAHLRIMSLSDFRPEEMSGWSNLGTTFLSNDGYPNPADTGLVGQVAAFRDFGIPSLAYMEITAHAQEIFKNGVGLQPGWEAALEVEVDKIRPHFGPGKAIRGVQLGDELCCRNITCWRQYEPYTAKLRALLGPSAVLYTNECALMGLRGWPGNITIAPEFDFFSVDTYQWDYREAGAGKAEVAQVKSAYSQLFPKLHPHQQLLIVPVRQRAEQEFAVVASVI